MTCRQCARAPCSVRYSDVSSQDLAACAACACNCYCRHCDQFAFILHKCQVCALLQFAYKQNPDVAPTIFFCRRIICDACASLPCCKSCCRQPTHEGQAAPSGSKITVKSGVCQHGDRAFSRAIQQPMLAILELNKSTAIPVPTDMPLWGTGCPPESRNPNATSERKFRAPILLDRVGMCAVLLHHIDIFQIMCQVQQFRQQVRCRPN